MEQEKPSKGPGLQAEAITNLSGVMGRLAAMPEPMQRVLSEYFLRLSDSVIAQNFRGYGINISQRRVEWYENRFNELLDKRWLNVHAEKELPPDVG